MPEEKLHYIYAYIIIHKLCTEGEMGWLEVEDKEMTRKREVRMKNGRNMERK